MNVSEVSVESNEEHLCNKCGKDSDILYGYKAYEMKDDEFYCEVCVEEEHPTYFVLDKSE